MWKTMVGEVVNNVWLSLFICRATASFLKVDLSKLASSHGNDGSKDWEASWFCNFGWPIYAVTWSVITCFQLLWVTVKHDVELNGTPCELLSLAVLCRQLQLHVMWLQMQGLGALQENTLWIAIYHHQQPESQLTWSWQPDSGNTARS